MNFSPFGRVFAGTPVWHNRARCANPDATRRLVNGPIDTPGFVHHAAGVFWRAHGNRNGWAAWWEAMMRSPPVPAPAAIRMTDVASEKVPDAAALGLAPDPCPSRQTGGRRERLALLKSFLNERGQPYRAAMSAPDSGADHCSRLSPHLAVGRFRCGRCWTGDITYIWTEEGWLYLAVVIDLFNRQVVGFAVGQRMTRTLVMDALRMAWFRRHPAPGLIFHSDRGSQGGFNRSSQHGAFRSA